MFANLFQSRLKHMHTHVPQRDSESLDSDTLLPSDPLTASLSLTANAVDRSSRDIRVAVKTLLLSTAVYLGVGLWLAYGARNAAFVTNVDDFCMRHISRYSPVVKNVSPGWHDKLFNGSFLHQNEYRQPASPETDAAWEALGVNYRSVVVSLDEAEQTGLRSEQVQISQEYGGGFPANVEGLHHLHCLNLLRKTLHWNYDYYRALGEGAFVNSEYIVQVHTTHCLDILRQVLMCNPDVGVLGQVWWQAEDEDYPSAFVDFNTVHRCRDHEAVRVWAEANQLPPEDQVNMSRFYEMPKPGTSVLTEIP
ncbi:hypothetical protein HBH56_174820 [Parastagonospora nodorum]|uniref:Tat pathway signal sequence n=1 Tax=Phaeosphaeria nodorum (strain SN15 / ATCC MYA-4574 / FGSC 10173) TaxID=321614 RepID=A0A7U2F4C9_PHANO|nr:hypothetical protein HBH56_174820 [Parastagonospora nodorum]QRC96319.1 hypothetical protein JI435_012540 [Parastagonospora nodorum SN15]KAH3926404.1 hypothetical protein HBH54_168330 [Parastagonospora nodorum]KAH4007272.1 hypothetical protein HBI10_008840 [Parastagonospora nodorum]KAH4023601.1 hypothetical protein HBI13_090550 [Parastagonospora nodorum]